MRSVSTMLLFLGIAVNLLAQSPHGTDLKLNCASCHTSAGWEIPFKNWKFEKTPQPRVSKVTGWEIGWDTTQFNHYATNFSLEGQHKQVDCRSCHASLVFTDASPECISCHTDVHQQTVGNDCSRCHTTANWLVDRIPQLHQDNGFPLIGAHAQANCVDCHKSEPALRFERIGNDCVSCHNNDFMATTNPNHPAAGFSTNCVDCHDLTRFDWTTDKVDHDFFPLTKGHDISDCAQCHTNGNYSNTPANCVSCHKNDFESALIPNHTLANFSQNCTECHTTDPDWTPATYLQHDADYFPIYSGAHKGQWDQCVDCHTNPANYAEFTCTTCHLNPETDNQHGGINGYAYNSPACLACHPTGDGNSTFDHNNTNFPLTGAHQTAACLDCHAAGYAGTPTDCASCHTTDYNQSANPNHVALAIPTDCASCHTTTGWEPATFAIHNNYYPLNGAHAAVANDCAACHNGNYTNTPNTCAGCHTPDYNQTTNPNHAAAQFPTDCASCHTESAWVPSSFNHNSFYPLNGAHATIANDCNACHNGNYTNTPNTCAGCHTTDYNQTTNPNHAAAQFPTDCATCHTESAWAPSSFDHNSFYPLNGAHATIANDCNACHNGNYTNTPNTCAGCHTTDYNQTTNPNHAAAQFPTDCATCHSETAWVPSSFDHSSFYPLTGAHAAIADDCNACHNGNYTNTPNTCAGCHTTDYNQTTNPNHNALGIPTDCATCHTNVDWVPATFAIHNNYYPLNGAHAAVANDCAACHNGNYTNTPNTCAGCHTPDYNQTTNPNHAAAQFPTDCATCHSETAWVPSSFDHSSFYPLTGAHAAIANDCNVCHNGNYTNTPNTCAGCHTTDYNQTTNPNHNALGIPTDCATCHTNVDWVPATFAIHNNYYPLNGAHAAVANDCAACHNGNYNNTPNTCAGCHTPDYNQTTNPNHAAAQFPTDCASCHSETAWVPATFDHDGQYFPIYSGTHNGEWDQCVDCHTNPSNFAEFTCTTCHTNPETNNNHNGINGYSYNSPACLACHPTGETNGAFDHNNTGFPLTGAHLAADCIDCHASGYAGTSTDCASCHTTDYNQSTNPNHLTLNIPMDCASCHTTTGWEPATFAIHNNYYPLNGAHAGISNDCAACHNGNYNNTPNTCAGCHITDYNQTTNPNHVAAQFPTDCATCHTESAWVPSTFDHSSFYPLTGAHAPIANDCNACHNGNYNNTPNTCEGCHMPDYNGSTNPNHVALVIPTDCASCHTNTGWEPATFAIHNNYYPLNGAHAGISNDCATCHNGNYNNTPNTCAGCHTPDYNQTTDPNHVAAQFSTNCTDCHDESAWVPSSFDHGTFYPLNGAHASLNCNACHVNNNYNNVPSTCYGCHQSEYTQANNPNHATAGFPITCQNCHDETAWVPSNFDHDGMYFPIYSGNHNNQWNQCSECHTNPSNYSIFNCLGCHTNPGTNNDHQGVNGYSYSSPACLSCHPNGNN